MHQADIAEKRCCIVLRAIESDRHLRGHVNSLESVKDLDTDMNNDNLSEQAKRNIYRCCFDKVFPNTDRDGKTQMDMRTFYSFLLARELQNKYGKELFYGLTKAILKALVRVKAVL